MDGQPAIDVCVYYVAYLHHAIQRSSTSARLLCAGSASESCRRPSRKDRKAQHHYTVDAEIIFTVICNVYFYVDVECHVPISTDIITVPFFIADLGVAQLSHVF
jgi:hypothetical protein